MASLKTTRPKKIPRNLIASKNRVDVIPNDINDLKNVVDSHADDLDNKESGASVLLASGTQVGSDTPTINKPAGKIVTASVSTAALATKTVTITNSFATAASIIFVSIGDYGGNGTPIVKEVTPGAGTIVVEILNAHATVALSAAMDLNFAIVG